MSKDSRRLLPIKLLRWFCKPEYFADIAGDLMEDYYYQVKCSSGRKAKWNLYKDVLLLFRPSMIKSFKGNQKLNSYDMFKHNLIVNWRNLRRNSGYTIINVGGLAIGMTVAMLIGLWIHDELTYNKYHDNYDSIVKLYRKQLWKGEAYANNNHVTATGTLLANDYGEHFEYLAMVRAKVENRVLAFEEKKFTQSGYFMQKDGPHMLTLNMKYGTRDGLNDMNSILLAETTARKLFGEGNPVGEVVRMDARWDLKVTGVYEDLPLNTEFHQATYFAPLDRYLDGWANLDTWKDYNMYVYGQIQAHTNIEGINEAIRDIIADGDDERLAKDHFELFLHPMSEWHLNSDHDDGKLVTSDQMSFIRFYALIGAFVLILACINFVNLSTARSEKRAKEVGVRKSIGSMRIQLIKQFLQESFIVASAALVLSLVLTTMLLPWFNEIAGKSVELLWSSTWFWLSALLFTAITALLAGSYPAMFLSSFSPVRALKGSVKASRFSGISRRGLVIFQFSVSLALIIGTIVVYQQIQFAKNRPVGYLREGLIELRPRSPEYRGNYQALRNEFLKTGVVEEMAEANYSVGSDMGWNNGFDWTGRDEDYDPSFNTIWVTHEYGATVGLEFVEGRDFSRDYPADLSGILLNESALAMMELEKPIGEIVNFNPGWRDARNYTIVGIAKDMVKGSPFEATDPSVIFLSKNDLSWLYIRIKEGVSVGEALPKIEKAFATIIPSAPFDYKFVDDMYDAKFKEEERVGSLAGFFSAVAIIISCLGLFGLSSHVAEQRTKEISIRKILGASTTQLWQMLSEEFVMMVIASCLVAMPVAYYVLNGWLDQYPYRTSISLWIFGAALGAALLASVVTVSYQAIKAALANPTNSLKSE